MYTTISKNQANTTGISRRQSSYDYPGDGVPSSVKKACSVAPRRGSAHKEVRRKTDRTDIIQALSQKNTPTNVVISIERGGLRDYSILFANYFANV